MRLRLSVLGICLAVVLAGWSASSASESADAFEVFGISAPSPQPQWTTPLMPMFQAASADYDVPLPLLLTLGFYGSAFENRGDAPTIEGGYGVMALRVNNTGGDSLTVGAKLIDVSEDMLKTDPAANIKAAAAVLDLYANDLKIDRSAGLQAWVDPIVRYAGLDPENSRFFAMEVFRTLKSGLDKVNSAGERFQFDPQDIGSVDLASLAPPQFAAPQVAAVTDYPYAIWDPAASCNYSTTIHSNDTVVIHTIEGTAAGCRSWFQNCNHGSLGPSSSHYVVDSAGTVWQMVRENETAWHAGCYNSRSVGIEHEGYAADPSHPKALYDGSALLTRDICDRWGIPKEKTTVGPGIIGHIDVTRCCCGTHTDPGNGWDWNYYIQQVVGKPPAEVVYVESRAPGKNYTWYSDDSAWANSSGWCNGFDNNLVAGGSRYLSSGGTHWCQVQPTLGVPGGRYKVEVSHYGTTNISPDIVVGISLTNCAGIFGTTDAYQASYSCNWVTLGEITLYPGVTQPTIRLNLSGGTISGSSRWNTEGFRFTLTRVPVMVSSCGGGAAAGGGYYETGDTVTVTATPNIGNCFTGWTTDGCGGTNVVSRSRSFTFTASAQGVRLYANFTKGLFYEGYEGLNPGDTNMNNPSGPNPAANGDKNSGNPWFGPNPPNGVVAVSSDGGVTAHGGARMMRASTGLRNCVDVVNAAFRFNNGVAFSGGIYLDWWFYDPKGAAADAYAYQDNTSLCNYNSSVISGAADYVSPVPSTLPAANQSLALGAGQDTAGAYDKTKYQARAMGAVGGYDQGWFNTSASRSVGWHHARIIVGPMEPGTNTNHVSFYVDDMQNAALAADSTTSYWYNAIQINTRPNSNNNVTGYFDDITFGKTPVSPDPMAQAGLTTNTIMWRWADRSNDEDGFHVWDDSGALKASLGMNTVGWTETGLPANTECPRSVSSFVTISGSPVDSDRTSLPTTWTLALPPVYGSSGDAAVNCNRGSGSASLSYPVGTSTVFSAVNGFGPGQPRASSCSYVWDNSPSEPDWGSASQWTSGDLSFAPTSEGSYYLHLRSVNGAGAVTATTLTLGPYVYESATSVSRIGEAWSYGDSIPLLLTNKTVSAAVPGAFWIEETDRSAAMKVGYSGAVTSGHAVNVYGVLDSSGPQRMMNASLVEDMGAAPSVITPVGVTAGNLGGSAFNPATPGVTGGIGLYNLGMLVRIAGQVTYSNNDNPLDKFFYVDDGSGLAGEHPGVKVLCGSADPPASGMVIVTGIVDAELSGSRIAPVIIIRDPAGTVIGLIK